MGHLSVNHGCFMACAKNIGKLRMFQRRIKLCAQSTHCTEHRDFADVLLPASPASPAGKKTPAHPYAPRGPAATVTAQAGITKPVKIFLDLNV